MVSNNKSIEGGAVISSTASTSPDVEFEGESLVNVAIASREKNARIAHAAKMYCDSEKDMCPHIFSVGDV
eukprot:5202247-Karenia_brevis.AAC.1